MRASPLGLVVVSTLFTLGCNHQQRDHALRATTASASTTAGATSVSTSVSTSKTSSGSSTSPVASAVPAGGATSASSTAVATSKAAPPTGSRFWYQNDTLGQPLEEHTAAEAALVADVFSRLNAERAKAGLAPLRRDGDAERAAKAQAEDMTDRAYFSHVTPEGWTPRDRLVRLGAAPWQGEGENIALGNPTAADVVAAWMASPMHRANILSTTFDLAGVGLAGGATPRWVTVFMVR